MLTVSQLFIYPIKSLGGSALSESLVTDRGLQFDRRWLLVDDQHRFLTQREHPEMALLGTSVTNNGLVVQHKENPGQQFLVPYAVDDTEPLRVAIWSDHCRALPVSRQADEWFSDVLSTKCRLVYMPDQSHRRVDTRYAHNHEITNFSDGYPFLIIGQASLDDLNSRLPEALPINRFRPNIVFTGGTPYMEDEMREFTIGQVRFFGVKLSARCVVTTIDQQTGNKGKEPLTTLASYRQKGKHIYFGQNLLHAGEGTIHIGDEILLKTKAAS